MMNKRFHKRAITAATAVMTLTTVVTSVDAAEKNEITIEASKSVVTAGDSFDLLLGYTPDNTGVCGFTIDLHYNTDAVQLIIPDESAYSPDSKFALVTNFEYEEGTVRIVGGDLNGNNIKTQTLIADLDFTVKDGYSGDIGFWTEVVDLVSADGEEFVNAEFNAFGEYTQYTITADTPATTTVPETAPPETEPEEQTEPETAPPETQPEPEPEPELPDTMIPPETVIIPDTKPEEETDLPEDVIPEEDSDSGESGTDTSAEDTEAPSDGEAIFEYKQGEKDFKGEDAVQYLFSPAEYTQQTDQTVDISVTVESDGMASGGIGMQTEEGWLIYSANANGTDEATWTAEDVDLSEVSGEIAVQLYYLEHDSEFKITGITISSDGEQPSQEETPAPAEDTDTDSGETDGNDAYADGGDSAQPEDNDTDVQPQEDYSAPEPEVTTVPETEAPPETTEPETETSETEESSEPEQTEEETTTTTAAAPAAAPSTTTPASAPSSSPSGRDSNPMTGSGILGGRALPFGIIALCLGQIGYSTFRLTRKED